MLNTTCKTLTKFCIDLLRVYLNNILVVHSVHSGAYVVQCVEYILAKICLICYATVEYVKGYTYNASNLGRSTTVIKGHWIMI